MKHFPLIFLTAFSLMLSLFSCNTKPSKNEAGQVNQDSLDHISDSVEYAQTLLLRDAFQGRVMATIETTPVDANIDGDAADDAAIWYDPINPMNSKLIGTDKKGGLMVFNLSGKMLHYHKFGRMNNVDLRQDVSLNGKKIDIIISSNRSRNSLDVFTINADGSLKEISNKPTIISKDTIDDVYGVCLYYHQKNKKLFAFINGTNGMVLQFELYATAKGTVGAKRIRNYQFSSQVEGMVADDRLGFLYVGQEEAGIFKVEANPDAAFRPVLIENSSEANTQIKYDLEGISLYNSSDSTGYLIVSSQGNFSYAVFKRQADNDYLGSFVITEGTVDGVEETDGLDITSRPFGDLFPTGFLVVQDGFNYDGQSKKAQNFKLVDWKSISELIKQWESN
jgi:3-phytase